MYSSNPKIERIVTQLSGLISADSGFAIWFAKKTFGTKQRIRLYRKLSALEKNGVKLNDAIRELKQRADKRSKTEAMAIVLHHVLTGLENGKTLADTLSPFIPVTETMVIQAGEDSGALGKSLSHCVEIIYAAQGMVAAVVQAITYPLILIIMLFCLIFFVGGFAIPKLAMLVDPETWAGSARMLYFIYKITQGTMIYVLIFAVIAGIAFVTWTFPRWTGRLRVYFDLIPPWSIYRLVTGSGWLLSFSALINAGVGVLDAVQQINATVANQNKWLSERMEAYAFQIEKGLNPGEALAATGLGFPDREIIDDLTIYASLPDFENVLARMGIEQINEIVASVESIAKLVNAILIILIGMIPLGIIIGTYSVAGSIGQNAY